MGAERRKRAWAFAGAIVGCSLLFGIESAQAGPWDELTGFLGSSDSGSLAPIGGDTTVRQGQPTQTEAGATAPKPEGTGHIQAPPAPAATHATADLQPFGASLFAGGGADGVLSPNPNYIIQVGDNVSIRTWGGVTAESAGAVDNQGNVFLPEVGPIHVAGTRAGDLESAVRRQLGNSYTTNVQIYAALQGTHQVGIFVTGFVKSPGRFLGAASDSVLEYLLRAGGIDPSRGSYRNITLQRAGKIIAKIDLYQFLLTGVLPPVDLKQDDAIVVAKQYPMVAVGGSVRNNYLFELPDTPTPGSEIVDLARPLPSATNVYITGTRNGRPYAVYLTADQFAKAPLFDQDNVTFFADQPASTISVQIQGSRIGPSVLVADRDNTLSAVLDNVAVDPKLADTKSIYILRQGLVQRQSQALQDAIDRLQKSLYYAISVTTGEAQIRASEAQLIQGYIDHARQIVPEGLLVVTDDNGKLADIRLEDNDTIVIPEKSQVVMVSGEVMMPQAVVFDPALSADDYIARSGGFSERGHEGNYMIRRANGRIYIDPTTPLLPGDELIVLPYIDSKNFQLMKDFIQVLYEVGAVGYFSTHL